MAKLIVVTRQQAEAGRSRLEKLMAKDPHWQEEKQEMERRVAEEKARRDAEFAARQAEQHEEQEKDQERRGSK